MRSSSPHRKPRGLHALLAVVLATASLSSARGAPPQLEVTFDESVHAGPYTGRVYVVTTQRAGQSPLEGVGWFDTQPFFAQDVDHWPPGEVLRFDPDRCLGYPSGLDNLPAGAYRLQAVLDLNGRSHDVIRAPGNGVSAVVKLEHDPDQPGSASLRINRTLPRPHLADTDDIKYVRLRSDLLSHFHGHYVHMYAAVAPPPRYQRNKARHYPTIYLVPGFGNTIQDWQWASFFRNLADNVGFEAVVVYLDADCPTGHHVFADSANNGPWGTALVTELIPYLEQRFRLIAEADARYLTGASSGGWSSLWLQITHPETFGGVWSLCPDPVDFSAFQTVDIYDADQNFLRDETGDLRPFSRHGLLGKALVLRDFCRMEEVLGRGGQFQSFDAVFSPRGPDGRPLPLWDRQTGRIDPQVAHAWKKYDIRLVLESNWETLGPRLRGKLHLFCGDQDDFFLDRAFEKLRDSLKRMGSDAYIDIVPGAGHALPPQVWIRAIEQMKMRFELHDPPQAAGHVPAELERDVRRSPYPLRSAGRVRVGLGDGEEPIEEPGGNRLEPIADGFDRGSAELRRDLLTAPGTEAQR
jgi:S-formylglutathione hydrolase FrmB